MEATDLCSHKTLLAASLPGSFSPASVSAMAVPPSSPGYHASRIAAACSLAHLTASALPFNMHDDHWLSGCRYCFQQLLLDCGQFNCCAVTAIEARHVNRHLFSFKLRRESNEHHRNVRLFSDSTASSRSSFDRRHPVQREARTEQRRMVRVFNT